MEHGEGGTWGREGDQQGCDGTAYSPKLPFSSGKLIPVERSVEILGELQTPPGSWPPLPWHH